MFVKRSIHLSLLVLLVFVATSLAEAFQCSAAGGCLAELRLYPCHLLIPAIEEGALLGYPPLGAIEVIEQAHAGLHVQAAASFAAVGAFRADLPLQAQQVVCHLAAGLHRARQRHPHLLLLPFPLPQRRL